MFNPQLRHGNLRMAFVLVIERKLVSVAPKQNGNRKCCAPENARPENIERREFKRRPPPRTGMPSLHYRDNRRRCSPEGQV